MARTNLSLGNLRQAVSGTVSGEFRLAQDGRGSAAQTSMLDFAFDGISSSLNGATAVILDTTERYRFNFYSSGSLFQQKLSPRTANSSLWDSSNSSVMIFAFDYGESADFVGAGGGSATIRGVWKDFYNVNATNYNTTCSLTVFVDI